ncbi:MAG: YCF48-related protein [Methanosarcinaceae archaeon]
MKRVPFLIMIEILVTFLFLHPVALFAQGAWKIIRETDFEARYSDVDFVDKNNGWVVGDGGLIIHTNDGGETWEYQESSTEETLYAVDFVDSLHGWTVGYNGTVLHTKDGGKNWLPQDLGSNYEAGGVCFIDTLKGWVVGRIKNKISHTEDGGATWTFQDAEDRCEDGFHEVFFTDSLCGWAFGVNIVHTVNGGRNWTVQYEALTGFSDCSFVNSMIGWAIGSEGRIVHTTDGGENWIVEQLRPGYSFGDVCFVDSLKGWIVGYTAAGPLILHTSDAGKNWNLQESGMNRGGLFSVCFIDSCTGLAVGKGGMGGYGTVLKYMCAPNTIKSHPLNGNIHPETFELLQNYPNPFNLETTIGFYVAKETQVSISIYNVLGRLVNNLIDNEIINSGYHEVYWNGKNQREEVISSGIYLCTFDYSGNYKAIKMITIK